ncbi:MAG: hypothetical protein LCH34_12830 [Firmicutes bacterium]|nr:hypothetical protein [Bacillota bacterium]
MKNAHMKQLVLVLLILSMLMLSLTGCAVNSEPLSTTDSTTGTLSESISESEPVLDAHEEWVKSNVVSWGLGKNFIDYVGNNRDYEWYVDQALTGDHAGANCGPSSVEMAGRWADATFDQTAENARSKFRPLGGWWYSDDITGSLEAFDIDYEVVDIKDAYTLRNIIDSGRIAIVNNTMNGIPLVSDDASRVNRFYSFDSGHYFIVKGYVLVDNLTYFEVYDPNNWEMTYDDGQEKGKDRYYESAVLLNSILGWYPYAVIINPSESN